MSPVRQQIRIVAAALAFSLIAAGSAAAKQPMAKAKAVEFHPIRNAPPGSNLPFSESVRVGRMLYLSGMIGTDASGKLVAGGIKPETRQVMENIGAALAESGASFDDLVQCTVALAEIADWPAFNEVYRDYFKHHFPARMAFAAGGLALGARTEVQCNAAIAKR